MRNCYPTCFFGLEQKKNKTVSKEKYGSNKVILFMAPTYPYIVLFFFHSSLKKSEGADTFNETQSLNLFHFVSLSSL